MPLIRLECGSKKSNILSCSVVGGNQRQKGVGAPAGGRGRSETEPPPRRRCEEDYEQDGVEALPVLRWESQP